MIKVDVKNETFEEWGSIFQRNCCAYDLAERLTARICLGGNPAAGKVWVCQIFVARMCSAVVGVV
jgi:hypothetical protein